MASSREVNPWLGLLPILGALALWRWWIAASLPLSVDEAYYYAWSLTPDWGYWTKPPLIAWAIGAAHGVCGASSACVRSVGVLAFTASSAMLCLLALRMGLGRPLALAVAVAFATLPLTSFYGMVASTDSLLLLCWSGAMLSLWLALQGRPSAWLMLGLCAGLGLLAKYSMAVLAPCVALVLLHPQWRHHWRQPGPWLAAIVALCIFSPNLWWNLNHGMPTLNHTAEISRGQAYSFKLDTMLGFLAEQWLVGNVVLVSAFVVWLVRSRLKLQPQGWFWLALSLPMLAVIATQALLSRAHANWAAPAHLALVMASVTFLWRGGHRFWLGAALVFNLLFSALLYHGQTLVREPLGLAASWRTDPYWSLRNWPGIHEQTARLLAQELDRSAWQVASDDRAVLAQLQWGLRLPAGAAMGWMPDGVPMNHFDQRFPLQERKGPILLVTRASEDAVMRLHPHARRAGPLKSDLLQGNELSLMAWWL